MYFRWGKRLFRHLPVSYTHLEPPFVATSDSPTRLTPELADLIPSNPNQPYNIKEMKMCIRDSYILYQADGSTRVINVNKKGRITDKTYATLPKDFQFPCDGS